MFAKGSSCSGVACSGFTLLEMLVALTLMAMLAGALYASLHIGLRASRGAEATVNPTRSVALALEFATRDLPAALQPVGVLAGPFLGTDAIDYASGGGMDTVVWHAAAGRSVEGGSDIVRIALEVVADESGEGGVLVRSETRNLLAPTEPEPTTETLCRRVASFELRYFDGTEWVDEWDSTAQGDTLPSLVEMALEVLGDSPDGETTRMTRVVALPCSRPAME